MKESNTENPKELPQGPGTSRVAATFFLWLLTAGLAGLVWLCSLDPFIGLPLVHPINLILLGICLAVGLGFTAVIWLPRRTE